MKDLHDNNYPGDDQGFPFDKNGKNPFSSPEGYFEGLDHKIFARIEAEEELEEFPALASIPKQQPFVVPAHYFENALAFGEELATYPHLAATAKPVLKMPEEGYFERSALQLLHQAELAEELAAYQTLQALGKQHGFVVSPAYFDNVAGEVRDRILAQDTQRATVFSRIADVLFRPRFALSFSVALLLTFSLWMYNRHDAVLPASADNDCKTLACLGKSDLLNDKVVHSLDEDNLFDIVDIKMLDKELSTSVSKPDTVVKEQYIMDNVNTDQLIDEL